MEAQTDTDMETRTVKLHDRKITGFRIPDGAPEQEKSMQDLVLRVLPKRQDSIALDRVLAYLEPSAVGARGVKIPTEPPTILVSTRSAVLVMVEG
jgi:hypothetical protein